MQQYTFLVWVFSCLRVIKIVYSCTTVCVYLYQMNNLFTQGTAVKSQSRRGGRGNQTTYFNQIFKSFLYFRCLKTVVHRWDIDYLYCCVSARSESMHKKTQWCIKAIGSKHRTTFYDFCVDPNIYTQKCTSFKCSTAHGPIEIALQTIVLKNKSIRQTNHMLYMQCIKEFVM